MDGASLVGPSNHGKALWFYFECNGKSLEGKERVGK